jgi:hypothetical protein
MSGTIQKSKIVAIVADQPDTNKISVVYLGGQDSSSFLSATVNITDDDGKFVTADPLSNVVGNTVTTTGKFTGKNHVVVVGSFTDGTKQVLLDTYV